MTADPWAANDPWATDELTETMPAWDTVEAPADENTNNGGSVSNVNVTSEDPITLTFKQHGGFDAPWTVLRAKSVDEAKDLLKAAVNEGLFQAVGWAAGEFVKTKAGMPTVTSNVQPAPQQSYQQPAQQAPQQQGQGDGRTCGPNGLHGQMKYQQGVSKKTGNPYTAYFCPLPQGDPNQCRAMFVKS